MNEQQKIQYIAHTISPTILNSIITNVFSFFLNTCQRSTEYLSRAKGKKYRTSEASTGDFFTRRVKRPLTNAACVATFVPENRKITNCPCQNLCSFWASAGVPNLPPAASWEWAARCRVFSPPVGFLTSPAPAGFEAPF